MGKGYEGAVVGSSPSVAIEKRLRQVTSPRQALARLIVAHLPVNGAMLGNRTIRSRTKTLKNDDYLDARSELVSVGLVHLGYGMGGSVGLVESFASDIGLGSEAPRGGLELSLYHDVKRRLISDIEMEGRFQSDPVVEITGLQGRRRTGGKWTRPDITVVARRQFKVLAGSHLEVHTYEVKTAAGLSIDSLHEARAQRRRAHRSYVVVDLESREQEDAVRGHIEEARDLGVGLLSFMSVDDESWNIWVDAPFNQPDPIDLDGFLATQLPEESQARIRSWYALPALGAD